MNNKYFIFFTVFIIFFLLSSSFAVDSTNWENIKVGEVDFIIPPKYQGGRQATENTYMLDTVYDFAIGCVDSYLSYSYGYDAQKFNNKNFTIGSHDVVFYNEYINSFGNYSSVAYFSCGNSIYYVSWEGDAINPEIEEIIRTSPDSSYSTNEFHMILDKAKIEYEKGIENEQYEIAMDKLDQIDRSNRRASPYFFYMVNPYLI